MGYCVLHQEQKVMNFIVLMEWYLKRTIHGSFIAGESVETSEIPEACPRWEADFERRLLWHSSFTWISDEVTHRVQLLVLLQSEFKESSEDANLPFRGSGLLWDQIRRIPKVSKPLDPIKARWHKSVKKTVHRVYYCFISFLFSSFEIKF